MGDYQMSEKETYVGLLKEVERPGITPLIQYLEEKGFFESPASTRFHLACDGGLLKHSLNVYRLFNKLCSVYKLKVDKESIILTSLLHDICKAGAYCKQVYGYEFNRNHPKGHACVSLERIKLHLNLSSQEQEIIKYHMGMYGLHEFSKNGEYSLMELQEVYNRNKLCKLFYFCDDMSAQFLEG